MVSKVRHAILVGHLLVQMLERLHIIIAVRIVCFGAIGWIEDILKGFAIVPSVTDIL